MHSYLITRSTPPNSDAVLRLKYWLPRQFAAQVISAALEFRQLLDMQASDALHNPDGPGDVLEGTRYRNAMTMLLAAVKGSLMPPPSRPERIKSDIVGIFALLAAEEFKYLLDVQAPNALFYPALSRKGRRDARQSAAYERADLLLRDARSQVLQATESLNNPSTGTQNVRCVVSNHPVDAAADVVQFHLDIDAALIGLGFKLANQGGGSAENSRLFEISIGGLRQVDEMRKPVNGQSEVVHSEPSEEVSETALCHARDSAKTFEGMEELDRDLQYAHMALAKAKLDVAVAENRRLKAACQKLANQSASIDAVMGVR